MNKILIIWTIIFILIGGGILLYGTSMNPVAWLNGDVTFTEPNNAPIPWGLLVIGYMLFGVIGTGVSTYNSLYELFNKNHQERNPFDKIKLRNEWLALAVLIPGWIMVFASTYKPGNAIFIYLSFRDTSRIAWNGVLYALVGIGIIAEILALIGEKIKEEKISGILKILVDIDALIVGYAILVELILDANLGSVYGYLSTWVEEFGAFMPILFVVLSFYGGIAMISFMTILYDWIKRPASIAPSDPSDHKDSIYRVLARDGLLSVISIGFLMLWWIWLTATNQETSPWASLLITGAYAPQFWIGLVLIGILLPITLYSIAYKRESKKLLFTSAIITLIGMFVIITLVTIIPQSITWYYSVSPITPSGSNWVYELRSIFNNGPLWTLLSFEISEYDIVWFTGSVLLLLGVYTLGVLLLPLESDEKPKHWIFK
ncbi:NrfD/PsrC family molybdoenzyme membrane anchor subunit [Stygiolobus azoricus]|uniref:Sulfur reduction protein DsrP n=1 Tax=Stygiolobus azoricus TaxID=41675 RepID=A0A650CPP4_9CREN|nr:NrfD/PsrC family molybdoenzyme membrane anchor subunit [Stygiolobus azoricus]QGR19816.1 sulfur reduction protein DsrP [Stygiolobus azoricus]